MSTNLSIPGMAAGTQALERFRAGMAETGSGGGGTGELYLRRKQDGSGYVYGADAVELNPKHRFAVGVHGFRHGYIVGSGAAAGNKVLEHRVIPMIEGARPTPPNGYGTYEGGGARDVTELVLDSVDEPGLQLTYTAWGISDANRVSNLMERILVHTEGDGRLFPAPVVELKVGSYQNKKWNKVINHFDFTIVDWTDGRRLQSEVGILAAPDDEAPWETEELEDGEAEFLGA